MFQNDNVLILMKKKKKFKVCDSTVQKFSLIWLESMTIEQVKFFFSVKIEFGNPYFQIL